MSRTLHPRPRKRRADDGRYLPKDALAWRRLVKRARQAARNPKTYADALGQAATKCARCVAPPGYAHRDSVFLRLLLQGMRVWQTRGEARIAAVEGLEALADQVAAVLDAPPAEANAVRERKDIYG